MTDRFVVASVQANPTLGAIEKNEAKARELIAQANAAGADVAVFPEMFLLGYPPEDLALKPAAVMACQAALERLAQATAGGCAVLMGTLWPGSGRLPRNAVALLDGGEVKEITFKVDLPNYSDFDENRVFEPGLGPKEFDIRGVKVGVPVCEDIWSPTVCAEFATLGAEIMLTPNGSPYRFTADDERMGVTSARVAETGLPLV